MTQTAMRIGIDACSTKIIYAGERMPPPPQPVVPAVRPSVEDDPRKRRRGEFSKMCYGLTFDYWGRPKNNKCYAVEF